jgi:glutamyl-tRNA synthetase
MAARRYRGRFAPSPTGPLHLGLARTALLGFLRARAAGGSFVLRIEDIDGPRVNAGAEEALRRDLRWLGITWDEGPDLGGPFGPYVQSARRGAYEDALAVLARKGLTYPCSCSRKEVAVASAPHGASELGPIYPGTCRDGPAHPGRPMAIRMRVPEVLPGFRDAVLGDVRPVPAGDFVVARADGLISYQLAVVVDDIAMQISEVLRGDDLAAATPLQLLLYEALDAPPPTFAHVPLLHGPDGRRLAKRDGAASVSSLRAQGTRPEEVIGRLAASAGLVPPGTACRAGELIAGFSLDKLRGARTQL